MTTETLKQVHYHNGVTWDVGKGNNYLQVDDADIEKNLISMQIAT